MFFHSTLRVALLAILVTPLLMASATASDPPRFTRAQLAAAVEPIAERAIREQKVVGLSVGIAHRGEPLYVQGFGMADRDNGIPATGDTQYDLASTGKMFTAVALLRLAEQGLIELDAPVSRYLPQFAGPMRDATIRHLLTHTAGFVDGPDELYLEPGKPEFSRPHSASEVLEMRIVTEARPFAAPGTSFRYTNGSFDVLGVVVETVAGRSYGTFVRDEILVPAGMSNTVVSEWPVGSHAAAAYRWDGESIGPAFYGHPSIYHGVYASVHDMLALQAALDAGRIISQASLATMREPATVTIGDEFVRVPYGMATMRGPFEMRQKLGHQGTARGGTAHFAHYPDDDLTIVVLTNTNGPGVVQAREIAARIAPELFGDQAPGLSRTPLPVDEEFARIATGRYRWNGFVNEVTWEEGELRVRNPATGELSGRLLRVGPLATTFVAAGVEMGEQLPAYRVGNPPYELGLLSPSGDRILWFREGGMFWDVGLREASGHRIEVGQTEADAPAARSYQGPVIDMHLHAYTAEDYWGSSAPNPVTGEPAPASAEEHMQRSLEVMRRYNVVLGAVSGSTLAAAEEWHRHDAQRVLRGLEMGDPQASIAPDTLRAFIQEDRLQVLGEITAQYEGYSPSDLAFDPYWAAAQEHGVPVGIHTGASFPGTPYQCCPRFRLRYGDPLLLEDMLVKHPRLKVYMMHAGGQYHAHAIDIMEMYPQVYAEIGVLSWLPGWTEEVLVSFLRAAQKRGMLDRVMFGSDQMAWPETIGMAVERIDGYDFLSAEEKAGVFYHNAARFLGLSAETIARHHQEAAGSRSPE